MVVDMVGFKGDFWEDKFIGKLLFETLTMIHEEETEADIVKDQVHPISEADRLLHRFPVKMRNRFWNTLKLGPVEYDRYNSSLKEKSPFSYESFWD